MRSWIHDLVKMKNKALSAKREKAPTEAELLKRIDELASLASFLELNFSDDLDRNQWIYSNLHAQYAFLQLYARRHGIELPKRGPLFEANPSRQAPDAGHGAFASFKSQKGASWGRLRVGGDVIINGVKFHGENISFGADGVIVDGVLQRGHDLDNCPLITIEVHGNATFIETTSGDVTVRGNADRIKTVSGDVTCGDISGNVSTVSGYVEAPTIGGNVSTVSGDVIGRAER